MGIAEGGHILIPLGEVAKIRDDLQQLASDIEKRVSVENKVGVIGDIARGRAEVDDPRRLGSDGAVGVDMRHDVVLEFLLLRGGVVKVDIGDVILQRLDLLRRDRQPELGLGAGELDPQAPPGFDPRPGGEEGAHVVGGVAGREWGGVVVGHKIAPFRKW